MPEYGLNTRSTEGGFLKYKNSKIHFVKFGSGEKLLIALHGYGDHAWIFSALESALENNYTVCAIDLPYHGQTQWEKGSFSKKDFVEIFRIIAKKEQKKSFELMGYSFGGRIVLASLFEIAEQLDKIYLIAPDGIQTKGMAKVLIFPTWLKNAIHGLLNRPAWLISFMEILNKTGLLSRFNFNFVKYNISSIERRERLLRTWISINDFKVDLRKVKKILKEKKIPVELYFGKHDKIIPTKVGEKLSGELSNVRLNVIEEGHLLLNEKLSRLITDQLKEQKP